MSFLTEMQDRISAQLHCDPLFMRAAEAFWAEPSLDSFASVAEHVAYAASPDETNELGGRFRKARRPTVANEFFYIALTERVLGVKGWLDKAITRTTITCGDWLDDRALLLRAGLSREAA